MSININKKTLEKEPLFIVIHVYGDSIESTNAMTKDEVNNHISDLIKVSEDPKESDNLKVFKYDWNEDPVSNDYFCYGTITTDEDGLEFKIFQLSFGSQHE